MTTEKVNDLQEVPLSDFFSPDTFRLVPAEVSGQAGGISEVPVIINAHFLSSNQLNFNVTKLQEFFGFARINPKLQEINKSPYYPKERGGRLEKITLNDSGALWIMVIELADEKKLFSVDGKDVVSLLNDCRKPKLL